jgi:hypothetical protein
VKTSLFLCCFFIILFVSSLTAQDEMEMSPDQKAWMEYMTPGTPHKMMESTVGEWTSKVKIWMDPSAEPIHTEGTATNQMIFGGRYLQTNHTGTMMGMPFEGMSIEGYDNASNEYFSTWIDNMGTGLAVSKGTYDEAANMLVMNGTMTDPVSKEEVNFKQTIKFIDDNTHVFEMYMMEGNEEFKSMEIEFKRK